jgi:hypothetical protein
MGLWAFSPQGATSPWTDCITSWKYSEERTNVNIDKYLKGDFGLIGRAP